MQRRKSNLQHVVKCVSTLPGHGGCQLWVPWAPAEQCGAWLQGLRATFDYNYKVQQVIVQQICCIPVPPGQLSHTGPCCHTQDRTALHFCGQPCPTCGC